MREICFYSICIFLFCSVSVAAQGVSFEGLCLDDLILDPGEFKPGFPDYQSISLSTSELKKFQSKDLFVKYKLKSFWCGKNLIDIPGVNDVYLRGLPICIFTDKLSLHFNTNKLTSGYRSINYIYSSGVNAELNYKISRCLELKGGIHYQYNIALKRWEWVCLAGIIFHF